MFMELKNTKIDLTDFPSCLSFNLRKAMRAATQHYDNALAPTGLRSTQFSILMVLSRKGAISISDLADVLVMDRTTLTRNLKPLQKKEYLKIQLDLHDRRSRSVSIIKAGSNVLNNALPYWHKAQNTMVEFLGKSTSKRFIRDLRLAATSHERM